MKGWLILSFLFLMCGCGDSNYNRGYVISKSHVEPEVQEAEE